MRVNYRGLSKCLLAFLFGAALAIAIAEILVRIFPGSFIQYSDSKAKFVSGYYDKDLGYSNAPNQKLVYCKDCFIIRPIYTNSLGFRDKEWVKPPGFRIALLGDSYVNAIESPQDSYPAAILERILNQRVFSAGLIGIGTVTELMIYRTRMRTLKPNLVVLYFLVTNDIVENSCSLSQLISGKVVNPCAMLSNGEISIQNRFVSFIGGEGYWRRLSPMGTFIKNHCLSCLVVKRAIWNKILSPIIYKQELRRQLRGYWELFRTTKAKIWEDAWQITEEMLASLKKDIESDGGKLVVVGFYDYFKGKNDWRNDYLRTTGLAHLPKDFSPSYPFLRLKEITQRQGINYFELEPYFLEYRNKFNLQSPYFSYWCDWHWNPLGHFIAAHAVAKYLIERNFVPLSSQEKLRLLRNIEQGLSLSPLEILGSKAYREIYSRGVYKGSSKITEILNKYGYL